MRFLLLLVILLTACTKTVEAPSDDYVLIEFASKLEEDYQKLNSQTEQKNQNKTGALYVRKTFWTNWVEF